jgi:dUTP pyrophosphatase
MKDFDIHPGEKAKIPTGVKVAIPYRHVGLVFGRSGLATDKGLRPSNCVGVIDSGYRGEIFVPLHNDSKEVQHVARYERIAQLVIVPIALPGFLVVDKLPESSRGEGGFGSTGQR